MFYLNGKYLKEDIALSVSDRGFLLGDGIFTTMRYENGQLMHFEDHLNRLNNDASKIYLNSNLNKKDIEEACYSVLRKNNIENSSAIIRITLTRGIGGRGVNFPKEITPTLLIKAVPYHEIYPNPIKICTTSIKRNEHSILSNIKSLNYLEQSLCRNEALQNDFDEGVMLNCRGDITECSVANLFFVTKNNKVVTPLISDGVLPGIIRNQVINLCNKSDIPIIEKSIPLSEAKDFIASFITNCVIGIKVVAQFNDITFNIHNQIIEKIINAYNFLSINSKG